VSCVLYIFPREPGIGGRAAAAAAAAGDTGEQCRMLLQLSEHLASVARSVRTQATIIGCTRRS